MTGLRKQLGARVRELRRAKKLTQEQLGELASLSYKFVGEIERGLANPTLESIENIARALDCDISELLTGRVPAVQKLIREDYFAVREAADSLNAILNRGRRRKR